MDLRWVVVAHNYSLSLFSLLVVAFQARALLDYVGAGGTLQGLFCEAVDSTTVLKGPVYFWCTLPLPATAHTHIS